MKIKQIETLKKNMRKFVKGHYYVNRSTLWEPFENYSAKEVKQFIEDDLKALRSFLIYNKVLTIKHTSKKG